MLYFPLSVSVLAAQPFKTEDVDQFVTNYIEWNGLPRTSIAIVKDGKLVYKKEMAKIPRAYK
ncbi:hypothetical protein [Cytobacillus firmus]|uniref:hypothetical protein n=1 Tax=Cytobacillus firmus TaxID=1399 RepID=UPI001F55A4CD|nr:hypothetical protein [Cytobacillus firmus]